MKKYLKLLALPILVFIIAIILLITNIPHLEYTYNKEYEGYFVTKAVGNAEYYKIKDTYKNEKVVGIGENAFNLHSNLKEVVLPDSIIIIERMAFNGCKSLKSINLDKVEEIERNAFEYCENLTNITVGAKKIGAAVFYKCSNLSDINLNNTKTIGDMCFSSTNIKSISIPRTCEKLGNDSFYNCPKLTQINVYGSYLKDNEYLNSLEIVNYIN